MQSSIRLSPHSVQTDRDYSLDILRIISIIGVVAIHVIGLVLGNKEITGSGDWWGAVILDIGFVWVVPVFIMISGAFTLRPTAHALGPMEFYKKRIARLLPALIAWHLIYIVGFRVLIDGERLVSKGMLVTILDAKPFTALYFFWVILGLYLVAPVFAAFLHQGGRRRWIITALIATSWGFSVYMLPSIFRMLDAERGFSLNILTYFIPFVGYYLLGFALHKIVLSRKSVMLLVVAVLCSISLAIFMYGAQRLGVDFGLLGILNPPNETSIGIFIVSCGIFLIVQNLKVFVLPNEKLRSLIITLSSASFGVFLIHLLFLRLIYFVVPNETIEASLGNALIAFIVIVMLSFGSVILLSKIPYVRRIIS
ncbi:MAG: acyltransferase family protein [Microbacteriaceae bacterium]